MTYSSASSHPTGAMSSRKRSRPPAEEIHADCPFTIDYVDSPSRAKQGRQKRKGNSCKCKDRNDAKRVQLQKFDFLCTSAFKAMDVHYVVEPSDRWLNMTRYKNFVQNGIKYTIGDFVIVANEQSIKRQRTENHTKDNDYKQHDNHWIAQILEIRASDEFHVYARVSWMYWPYELPSGTLQGKMQIEGRQPYHGASELITSNHMDVIDVMSITEPTTVRRWIESEDEEIKDTFCYRQAYNCRTSLLSPVDKICKCQTPANPDRMQIGCTSSKCGKWMHYECLFDDVLQRLGTESSHEIEGPSMNEYNSEGLTFSFSPTTERRVQSTSEAPPEKTRDAVPVALAGEGCTFNIKQLTPVSTPPRAIPTLIEGSTKTYYRKDTLSHKPYEGLFKIGLMMEGGPIRWEVCDLRDERCWAERVFCLLCSAILE
jgi:hypothetical protein